jgi:DNA-binding NtrC family response regulator
LNYRRCVIGPKISACWSTILQWITLLGSTSGITAISEEFMAALARHSWPGNIRELQSLIERSVILSTGVVLSGSVPELPHTTHDESK